MQFEYDIIKTIGLVIKSPTISHWCQKVKKFGVPVVKFIYSEKAKNFCEIFTLLLTVCTVVKSKVKISQNFVAFSEYMTLSKQALRALSSGFCDLSTLLMRYHTQISIVNGRGTEGLHLISFSKLFLLFMSGIFPNCKIFFYYASSD